MFTVGYLLSAIPFNNRTLIGADYAQSTNAYGKPSPQMLSEAGDIQKATLLRSLLVDDVTGDFMHAAQRIWAIYPIYKILAYICAGLLIFPNLPLAKSGSQMSGVPPAPTLGSNLLAGTGAGIFG